MLHLFLGAGQQVFQKFRDDEQARPAVFIGRQASAAAPKALTLAPESP